MQEMIELFRAEDVNRAASRFDFDKLAWINQHYLKTDDPVSLVPHFQWHLENASIDVSRGPDPAEVIVALRDRVKTLKDMAERAKVWYLGIAEWDEAAVAKHLQGAGDVLKAVRERLEAISEWTTPNVDTALRATAEALGVGMGKVAQPVRVAMTGTAVSPNIDMTVHLCGKEGALARLDAALAKIGA